MGLKELRKLLGDAEGLYNFLRELNEKTYGKGDET